MDALTHVFLPLTVAVAIRPDLFDSPLAFGVGGLGLLADFDKFLGMPGSLHSLVTLGPLCLAALAIERVYRGRVRWSGVFTAFVGSHLVLDLLDGGPVPLLAPLAQTGIGLEYPVRTHFGAGLLGVAFEGPPVAMRTVAPRPGFNTYGFVKGAGVAWLLAFVVVVIGQRYPGVFGGGRA